MFTLFIFSSFLQKLEYLIDSNSTAHVSSKLTKQEHIQDRLKELIKTMGGSMNIEKISNWINVSFTPHSETFF